MQDFTVVINKMELIEKIQANRDKHRAIFEEALEGYRQAAITAFSERLDKIKARKPFTINFNLHEPQDHTGDYDRVLTMLKMHQGQTLELGQEDFAMYVLDDWSWKRQWIASNTQYSQTLSSNAGR